MNSFIKDIRARLQKVHPCVWLWIGFVLSLSYLGLLLVIRPYDNLFLFAILCLISVYYTQQSLMLAYTVTPRRSKRKPIHTFDSNFCEPVDIFVTVCGEPVSVVDQTVRGAIAQDYPNFKVYVLNDGKVTGQENWRDIEDLCRKLGVTCITREIPGGAKAGNLNRALQVTSSPFFVVQDADHIPCPVFLRKMMGYFCDERVGFVQSPQYYRNEKTSAVARVAWEQQKFFCHPIVGGKDQRNATFLCGTNMAIRRKALLEAGGFTEDNVCEDFATSLRIHAKGWKSVYMPEHVSGGLGPEDMHSYFRQQYRWARGCLEVFTKYNPFRIKGLSFNQRIQYFASGTHWLQGTMYLGGILLPLSYLLIQIGPLSGSAMIHLAVGLPLMGAFLTIRTIQKHYEFDIRALSFTFGSLSPHVKAFLDLWTPKVPKFTVTPKTRITGNFFPLVYPHLAIVVISVFAIIVCLIREGPTVAFVGNTFWLVLLVGCLFPAIKLAYSIETREAILGAWSNLRDKCLSPRTTIKEMGRYLDGVVLWRRNGHKNNSRESNLESEEVELSQNQNESNCGPLIPRFYRGIVMYRRILVPILLIFVCVKLYAAFSSGAPNLSDNPFRDIRLYKHPWTIASKYVESIEKTQPDQAKIVAKIADQPVCIWLAGLNSNVRTMVKDTVNRAEEQDALPVFVVYNIPDRDSARLYSSGGASSKWSYLRWIKQIRRGIGDSKAVIILEPDAVLMSNLLSPIQREGRFSILTEAIQILGVPNISIYLDAGHSDGLMDHQAVLYLKESGIEGCRGFSLNISNFQRTEDLIDYGERISSLLGGGKHFVIDTSRNGSGYNGEWCNPLGRSLGQRPSSETNHELVDAFLWVKPPGESDGDCNGGPPAGQFWPEYAVGLVERAKWD